MSTENKVFVDGVEQFNVTVEISGGVATVTPNDGGSSGNSGGGPGDGDIGP